MKIPHISELTYTTGGEGASLLGLLGQTTGLNIDSGGILGRRASPRPATAGAVNLSSNSLDPQSGGLDCVVPERHGYHGLNAGKACFLI